MRPSRGDVAYCKAITQQYARSYYWGTRRLPKETREWVYVLYAFVRYPDNLVDEPLPGTDPQTELSAWREKWLRARDHEDQSEPILRSFALLRETFQIPDTWIDAFLDAMEWDTYIEGYATMEDLVDYMFGSATVVGYMMARIMGAPDESLPAARALGEAFQLTNFLRDVREDLELRNRLYLPLEDMERFGVSEEQLRARRITPGYQELLEALLRATELRYQEAEAGLHWLPNEMVPGIRRAIRMYLFVHQNLRANAYDNLTKSVRTKPLQRLRVLLG